MQLVISFGLMIELVDIKHSTTLRGKVGGDSREATDRVTNGCRLREGPRGRRRVG